MRLVPRPSSIGADHGEDVLPIPQMLGGSLDDVPPAHRRQKDAEALGIVGLPHLSIVRRGRVPDKSLLERCP
jgi:hypothetical protein